MGHSGLSRDGPQSETDRRIVQHPVVTTVGLGAPMLYLESFLREGRVVGLCWAN